MGFEVRPPAPEEFPLYARTNSAAFAYVPTEDDIERSRAFLEQDRTLAAYEAERMVGTAAALSYHLTLPGGASVPVAAVTWVAVLPTDRRRGVLRALMRQQLDDTRRRGEPIAVLMASESGIYGRFGYGLATSVQDVEIERVHAALRMRPEGRGHVRLVERERALEVFPALWERHRRAQHGALTRPPVWWDQVLRSAADAGPRAHGPLFFAVYESEAGIPEGAVRYRVERDWNMGLPSSVLVVDDVIGQTPETLAALWDYLFGVDLIATVRARNRPIDDPLRWMLADPRRLRVLRQVDDLWVRLLDIPAALTVRRYAAADQLVLGMTDPFIPENAGRYLIEAGPDGAICRPTTDAADLALDVADLGAAYLGGVRFATLARAGRVHELRAGALERADALFATPTAPYSGTGF